MERAAEHWFSRGPLVEAVLASCAVPGLLPPVQLDGQTYLDGGLVHSIPVGRAVALGATTLYVLQVGRIEQPLAAPQRPWEVGLVAFEVARRHRFAADMASLPPGVTVHVLPTGAPERAPDLRSQLRYRDRSGIARRIDSAYAATRRTSRADPARIAAKSLRPPNLGSEKPNRRSYPASGVLAYLWGI